MNKVLYFKEIPRVYKKRLLGKGTDGKCYLTKDNKALKVFNNEGVYDEFTLRMLELESEYFAFPEQLIFLKEEDKEKYAGYIRPYYDGVTLQNMSDKTNFSEFIIALDKFEKEVKRIASYGIFLFDMSPDNLILTKDKKIVCIDTDVFEPASNYSYMNPIHDSILELFESMKKIFGNFEYNVDGLNKYVDLCMQGGCTPSKLILEVYKYLDKFIDIETIGDFKEGQKLILK